jgi:RNA polymerase sigma factor (sigma-70 family)
MKGAVGHFQELLTQERTALRRYAFHLTRDADHADDLVQDCLLKALLNQEKFHAGTDVSAWLRTLVRNTFINQYRRQRLTRELEGDIDVHKYSVSRARSGDDPLSDLMTVDLNSRLNTLQACFREAFTLHGEGFKYEEIAERLAVPVGTVKSRIHQARRLLQVSCGTGMWS